MYNKKKSYSGCTLADIDALAALRVIGGVSSVFNSTVPHKMTAK